MRHSLSTLVVVSHVMHYQHNGRLFAYTPYAREIDVWADLFENVVIAAPCRAAAPPGDTAALAQPNVTIAPQVASGGDTLGAKLAQLAKLPAIVLGLALAMRRADAIHVRCPGNLGLVGAVMAPLFSRHLVAKYAGQWNGGAHDTWTTRLQRAILRSAWWRGPVTVYGEWPGQPPNVVPFFTSVLGADHMARARHAACQPRRIPPVVLFVGRLSRSKNVDVLIEALAATRDAGVPYRAIVAGDGPERQRLEALAAARKIQAQVTFVGAIPFGGVLDLYEESSLLVLASDTEGWPKAITEAMAFGLVCIGSACGLVPRILQDGRGFIVPPRDPAALAAVLCQVLGNASDCTTMRARAAAWGQQYSLDTLRRELSRLLASHWGSAFQPRMQPNASLEKSAS